MSAPADTADAWTERAERAETSWDAALWSERGQTRRMLAVVSHLRLRTWESVLDYGCGTGRLCTFLPRNVAYVGYDQAPGMIARAEREHPGELFTAIPPVGRYDHVAAVGVWNLNPRRAFDDIARLWQRLARRSLVASLLRWEFDAGDVAKLGARLASEWLLDASHLDNDLILVLRR